MSSSKRCPHFLPKVIQNFFRPKTDTSDDSLEQDSQVEPSVDEQSLDELDELDEQLELDEMDELDEQLELELLEHRVVVQVVSVQVSVVEQVELQGTVLDPQAVGFPG